MTQNRILLVDDNAVFVQRLKCLLSESDPNYSIDTASDKYEAAGLLRSASFDLILLDIHLPGPSGIHLLQEMRNHNWHGQVIMLTNCSGRPYREECRKLGAPHFLDKTKDIEELLPLVQELLSPLSLSA